MSRPRRPGTGCVTSEERVSRQLCALAAAMRAARVRVGLGELLSAHRALAAVDAADRTEAYHALRCALCSTRADYDAFEAAFEATFGELAAESTRSSTSTERGGEPGWARPPDAGEDDEEAPPAPPTGWSDLEQLRRADFATL